MELETLFISFIGGVSAALVSHIFSGWKSRQSELKDIINITLDELELSIDRVANTSSALWSEKFNLGDPRRDDVVSEIHNISELCTFLDGKVSGIKLRIKSPFYNFRMQTSGGDFDTSGRAADPTRVVAIRAVAMEFKIALREAKYSWNKVF